VRGDHGAGVEAREDPLPVVAGEVAAGDAGEEDVDLTRDRIAERLGF
jgi:hypothetical protein